MPVDEHYAIWPRCPNHVLARRSDGVWSPAERSEPSWASSHIGRGILPMFGRACAGSSTLYEALKGYQLAGLKPRCKKNAARGTWRVVVGGGGGWWVSGVRV